MLNIRTLLRHAAVGAAAIILTFAASSFGADIYDDWATATPPPRPELKPVTVDTSTTALLILDISKNRCSATERVRCLASLPAIKRLYDAARKSGMLVWYSGGSNPAATAADVPESIAPREGEWIGVSGPDKFIHSNLEEKLKARGVKTVIVCGASFQGVGIGTASGSTQRGYQVIIPIDCLWSEDTYREQYSFYHLAVGGPKVVISHVTATRSTMMKF
jgi:nicotinamidase-related amidase